MAAGASIMAPIWAAARAPANETRASGACLWRRHRPTNDALYEFRRRTVARRPASPTSGARAQGARAGSKRPT